MNTCATRPSLVALCITLLANSAAGNDLERYAELTLGGRIYDLHRRFDDDNVTSFFDQYRTIDTKDADTPYFVDLFHVDAGLVREDETHLLRFERWSPHAWNDRARLDLNWKGLRFESRYHRFRTEELRRFPVGTFQEAAVPPPAVGAFFNDDAPADDRFFIRRTGISGNVRLRPEGFGFGAGPLRELALVSRFEHRSGYRQDRFALDSTEVGAAAQNARFRAFRREVDQDLTTVGAQLVLTPWQLLTGAFDLSFETFRNEADTVTLAQIARFDPPAIVPGTADPRRTFGFIPDTDRLTASLKVSRRVSGATLHGGAFVTRLKQVTSRTPLQEANDLDRNTVTTQSYHAAATVPLGRAAGFSGFVKYVARHNGLERDTALFRDDNGTQVDPFLEDRSVLRGGGELTVIPGPGSLVGLGYRGAFIRRSLRFAKPVMSDLVTPNQAILPETTVIRDDARSHTFYVRSRVRPLRGLRVSGEIGTQWAPEVSDPREFESSYYLKGRSSWMGRRPVPMTVAIFGDLTDGDSSEILLRGATRSRSKDFDRRRWRAGATLSALPRERLALFGSVAQHHDEQTFAHLRSDFPRYFAPILPVDFFIDSSDDYQSDLWVFLVGGSVQLTRKIDATLSAGLTRIQVDFGSGGMTADVLEEVNRIDSTITSVEATLAYQFLPEIRCQVGYRLDRFSDHARIESLDFDTREHTFTLAVTIDLDLLPRQ